MSTTFEVYPTNSYIPKMTELVALANEKLHAFLNPLELTVTPVIQARIGDTFIDGTSSIQWTAQWEVQYAWFFVSPSNDGGGSDAYYNTVDEDIVEIWEEYEDAGERYTEVLKSLSIGHYWTFRRSAGQPAVINLAYGFLAAALAEMTDGYIFSDDGAWPGPPIRAAEFEVQYFNPTLANNYADASWYVQCLTRLTEVYLGKNYVSGVRLLTEHDWPMNQRPRYAPSGRSILEGPDESDRLIILHSQYINFPYVVMNRALVKVDEQVLLRILNLMEIKEGFKLGRQPVNLVQEIDIAPMLADRDFAFWSNPLLILDGESIRRQLIRDHLTK